MAVNLLNLLIENWGDDFTAKSPQGMGGPSISQSGLLLPHIRKYYSLMKMEVNAIL